MDGRERWSGVHVELKRGYSVGEGLDDQLIIFVRYGFSERMLVKEKDSYPLKNPSPKAVMEVLVDASHKSGVENFVEAAKKCGGCWYNSRQWIEWDELVPPPKVIN